MKIIKLSLFTLWILMASSHADDQNKPLKPKRVHTIANQKEAEDLQKTAGFGKSEPEIRMMNLMMIEGSGMEGMDMSHK